MNVYKISDLDFEPIIMLSDHHERAISKFQWSLAGAFGFLPPVNFSLSWVDPSTLPSPEALQSLVAADLEGFAQCTMRKWERFEFR